MAFTARQILRIEQALRAKLGESFGSCMACRFTKLTLANGYGRINLQSDMQGNLLDSPILPNIVLVCSNCGYTHLFNVFSLGLTDLGPIELDTPRE